MPRDVHGNKRVSLDGSSVGNSMKYSARFLLTGVQDDCKIILGKGFLKSTSKPVSDRLINIAS